MARGLNLKAVLKLEDSQFRKGINNIKRQLAGFSNFLKGAFAIGSISAFSKQLVQVGADFENAMARVQAVSNATTKEFQAMQKEAQRLGASTKYTATEAASALEALTRNGLSASQATKALAGVLQLAQANAIELANAADIVTNTMNAFGLSVNEITRVNDVMSSTASHAATNINELYEAMVVAGPYAKIMGGSIEEAASAIGVLANKGIKGSSAGKALAAMYQRLSAITPKAAKVLAEYGLEIDENVVKNQEFSKTLKQLADSGIGNSVEALTNLFGKNYAGDIAQLINATGDFDDMLNTLANSAGTTERMFNQGIGSVRKELDTLKSMYEGLLISISQKTDGVVKGVIRLLQNLIINFKSVGGTIMNIASVLVPLLSKNIVALGRTIKTTVTTTASAVATAKALVGGLIPLIASLVTWVGTALVGAWNRAHQAMKDAKKEMASAENEITNTTIKANNLIKKLGDKNNPATLAGVVSQLIELFPDFATQIKEAARIASETGDWETLRSILQDIVELQNSIVRKKANESILGASNDMLASQMNTASKNRWWSWGADTHTRNMSKYSHYEYGPDGTAKQVIDNVENLNRLIRVEMQNAGHSDALIQKTWTSLASYINSDEAYEVIAKNIKSHIEAVAPETAERQDIDKLIRRFYDYWSGSKPGTSGRKAAQEITAAGDFEASKAIEAARKVFLEHKASIDAQVEEGKLSKIEAEKQMTQHAQTFADVISTNLARFKDEDAQKQFITELQQITDTYKLAQKNRDVRNNPDGGGNNGGNPDTDAKKVKKALDDYHETMDKLNNRQAAGTITQEEYADEVEKISVATVEAITSFSNFNDILQELGATAQSQYQELSNAYAAAKKKDADAAKAKKDEEIAKQKKALASFKIKEKSERETLFDFEKSKLDIQEEEVKIQFDYADSLNEMKAALQTAIENGQFDEIKAAAVTVLGIIAGKAAEVTKEANKMNEALAAAKAAEQLRALQQAFQDSVIDSVETATSAIERMYGGIRSIAEAFGEEIEWEGMEKFISLINGAVSIFEAFKSVIDAVRASEEIYQQIKDKNAIKTVAENEAITQSEIKKSVANAGDAVAGGASSVANIPYVGAILAVAAAASIAAALLTNMGKFANGGIVGGNSYSGDRTIIRANAGEAVLTRQDQATLFNAIRSGNLGTGGQVEFRIKGSTLIGAIENEKNKRKG